MDTEILPAVESAMSHAVGRPVRVSCRTSGGDMVLTAVTRVGETDVQVNRLLLGQDKAVAENLIVRAANLLTEDLREAMAQEASA